MNSFFQILYASVNSYNNGGTPPASGYSAESTSAFSYFTGTEELSTSEKVAIDRFINGQVANGNWSKIKALQLNSGLSTASKALIDLISGVIATNNGTTYNPLTGFTTDGTSSYINTNIIPSDTLTLNNAGMLVYPLGTSGGLISLGAISSSPNTTHQMAVTYNDSTRTIASKITSGSTLSKVMPSAYQIDKTLIGGYRNASNISYAVYNGDVISGVSNTSAGVPNVPIYLGAQNFNGATSFGASSYGAFILIEGIGFNFGAFNFYFEQLMAELGVSTAESLYNISEAPAYDNSEVLLLNSEGQSNSLFEGKATNLNYQELIDPIIGANMYYMNPLGATPVKGNLEYMVNHTNARDASTEDNFGGGMRMSKELTKQPLEFHLWAYNKSGTSLAQVAGKDWNVASTNEFFYETNELLGDKILPMITKPINKLVWHWNQGEGDDGRTEAQYTADLYAYLNAKIGVYEAQGIDLATTDFHVIITRIWGGIVTDFPSLSEIINAQNNFSLSNFESAYPSQAGKIKTFKVYDNEKTYHTDNVHMAAEGYHTEGYRLANYISKL